MEMLGFALAILGMSSVIVLGGIGSSIGVGLAAQMASGAIAEEPQKFGKLIPFIVLPGTQGFYSLLIGFFVMMRLNFLETPITNISPDVGLQILFICLPMGFVEMISAIHQGKVAASAINIAIKREEEAGKALILPAFVEIYAVLGLAIAFFLLQGVRI
jgi:V/A-type H+-transporting ATPase subunit K